MANSEELIRLSAVEAVEALVWKDVRPVELLDAVIERTEQVDSSVNALPTRFFEQAREWARAFEDRRPDASDEKPGWLAGLPMVAKEYNDVAGQRTTYGSPIFADNYVAESDLTVRTLEKSGGIVFAKSNVPEFAGSNTFNSVFGVTRNPWDFRMTAGGSSGGAAAALASGIAWLAMGSDLGDSLRISASYCGIVGLRPSVGRDPLWVEGHMARNVAALALMLDAQAFQSPEDPISQPPSRRSFMEVVWEARPSRRVAFSADLETLGRRYRGGWDHQSRLGTLCKRRWGTE